MSTSDTPVSTEPRSERVEALVQAALSGMTPLSRHSTGGEVLSAVMTLALRLVKSSVEMGVDIELLRESVAQIYNTLPTPVKH